MKLTFPEFNFVVDTDLETKVNALVIENKSLFVRFVSDLFAQENGMDGKSVLSQNGKIINIGKCLEIHSQFVPFDINKKSLITRLCSKMENIALNGEEYEETMELMMQLERFFLGLACKLDGEIVFQKLNISSIIKSIGVAFENECDNICEKLLNYMELVSNYEQEKLFVFVNLRSYVEDEMLYQLFDTILRKGYHVLMIDNAEYEHLDNEKRIIIDSDLCEIL